MANSSDEWLHFQQHNHQSTTTAAAASSAATDLFWSGQVFESAAVSTTAANPPGPPGPPGPAAQESRVSRPARRRTRASRRTPTTLLNTDPTNFRAMVQQFTGGPSGAAAFPPLSSFTVTGPGIQDYRAQMVTRPGSGPGYEMQFSYNDTNNNNNNIRNMELLRRAGSGPGGPFTSGGVDMGYPGPDSGPTSRENRNNNSFQF